MAALVPLLSVTNSAARILFGPVVDIVVKHLKDGDVVDEWVCERLKNVKSKLECLSLKELHTSKSFLEEGVQLLCLALEKSNEDENEKSLKEASKISCDSISGILKSASSLPTQGWNIFSTNRFLAAKDSFKLSREEATRSFNNGDLLSKDRIMACKLRVAARIFESGLEDPEIAIAAYLVALKQLHGLLGIQEMFSVFLKGAVKSWLKTEERLENIKSVLSINHILFDFASKHSSEYPNVFTWPGIQLEDRKVNPILHACEILEKMSSSEEYLGQLSRVADERIRGCCFAVNSRSEVVLLGDYRITVIKSIGECKDLLFPEFKESIVACSRGKAIAVDGNDNVYVARFVRTRYRYSDKENVVLDVFDENFNLMHETALDFLDTSNVIYVKIAVDKNGNIIMIQSDNKHIYVCNSEGQLKFRFEEDIDWAFSLCTSGNNNIIIPSNDHRSIHVYTTEGNLKSTFETPEGHKIEEVAFHHGISKLIVLTYVKEQKHKSLLCYSETGGLENLEVLCDESRWNMKSHPSGLFAVRLGKCISFL